MELENVQGQGKQEPFSFDFFLPTQEKLAEIQIFLDISEGAFGLDGTIDTQDFSLGRVDFFFHSLPLTQKSLGDI